MNNRVYSALRKSSSGKALVVTREADPSLTGVVNTVKSAPDLIEAGISASADANRPQYVKDYQATINELFGDETNAAAYVDSLGSRGRNALKALKWMREDAGPDSPVDKATLRAMSVILDDVKHEADTKGLNWGSAGSYGASALAMGGLGRLIAGKENAGWGWGGGILAGLLANYIRRKTYYGKNIAV